MFGIPAFSPMSASLVELLELFDPTMISASISEVICFTASCRLVVA